MRADVEVNKKLSKELKGIVKGAKAGLNHQKLKVKN